jgi:cysteine dioxygenase
MNLDDLFEKITEGLREGLNLQELSFYLAEYKGVDWKPYKYFTASHYTRFTYKLNEILEIVLICWEPGQFCPLHDHPKGGCLIRILQGEMKQTTYELDVNPRLIGTNTMTVNDIVYMEGNAMGHEMQNVSGKRAVSLHLYSPSNYRPNFYSDLII